MVNAGTDDVSVIDIRSHEVIATIAVGEEPMMAALSPDRRHLSIGGAFNARPLGVQAEATPGAGLSRSIWISADC